MLSSLFLHVGGMYTLILPLAYAERDFHQFGPQLLVHQVEVVSTLT